MDNLLSLYEVKITREWPGGKNTYYLLVMAVDKSTILECVDHEYINEVLITMIKKNVTHGRYCYRVVACNEGSIFYHTEMSYD
jgi:hypothetical protein